MPEMSSYAPGTFCWADLATPDAAASKSFYAKLLGWTAEDNPVGDTGMVYSMMQKDGKYVCGLYQMDSGMLEQGTPPHWTSYLASADVDAAVQKVIAAGGQTLVGPTDVFEAGRMAMVQDTDGARFGIWQAKEHFGAGLMYESGALGWNELYCNNTEACETFYQQVFGWGSRQNPMGVEYTMFTLGESQVGGMMKIKSEWGAVPPNWSIYLCVDDCAASLQQALDLGAEVVVPVTNMGTITFTFIKDPQGVYLGLVSM